MNSIILQIASRYLKVLLLAFAFIALIRGHNYPGGGFIGGLLAALSIVYGSLAFTTREIEKKLKVKPDHYIAAGILLILLSFLPSLIQSEPLMKGVWLTLVVPVIKEIKLGTPLLFDIGVFLAVIGVTLMFLFTLSTKD